MTKLKALTVLCAALAPGLALAWIEYSDMEHFFSINFPREPDVRDFAYVSEYRATLPGRVYSVTDGATVHSLTVVDYNDAVPRYEEIAEKTDDTNPTTMWIYDQRGAIAYEAAKMRARARNVLYDGWHHIDRVEGLNLVLENADGSHTYASLYLHARRLYMLEATVPPGGPPQGLFQQSLAFLDAEGKQIRYDLTPEGERTRIR